MLSWNYGRALARAGFRYIMVTNGHAGPGHLVALEEASAIVSRRHRVAMASITGHMAWELVRGRYLPRIEAALGRSLTVEERQAFAGDADGGWWETSLMLLLRPDLDLAFAKATLEVLLTEATELCERLLDARLEARHHRSPFRLVPLLRTDFWPVAGAAVAAGLAGLWLGRASERRARAPRSSGTPVSDPRPAPEEGVSIR